MVLTYKECIERFGSDYMIKKEISEGNLFQKGKGLYSDSELCSELEIIVVKYPRAVFTGESAYYYHGFTDVIPDFYCLATRRGDTRIKDKSIRQIYVNDNLYDFGKRTMEYQNTDISIYSKERLLVDLIRFKAKFPVALAFYTSGGECVTQPMKHYWRNIQPTKQTAECLAVGTWLLGFGTVAYYILTA